jgi:phospholipase/carboxylesterase
VSELAYVERRAAGEAEGLLVLHHGRGTDERDLLPLADVLDPERRLHVVSPRGPLVLPGAPGRHWYVVPRVGAPDPRTFHDSYAKLAALHDELWERLPLGPERTVLGGFSMGCVMSYALGLGGDRPAPAGILALSGFVPRVEDWEPDLAPRRGLPVLIAHGRADPVIAVEFARAARTLLADGGLDVSYHESHGGHQVDAALATLAAGWLRRVLAGERGPG